MRDNWQQPTRSSELLLRLRPITNKHPERGPESWEDAVRPQQTPKTTGGKWGGGVVKAGRMATISMLEKVLRTERGRPWRTQRYWRYQYKQ